MHKTFVYSELLTIVPILPLLALLSAITTQDPQLLFCHPCTTTKVFYISSHTKLHMVPYQTTMIDIIVREFHLRQYLSPTSEMIKYASPQQILQD